MSNKIIERYLLGTEISEPIKRIIKRGCITVDLNAGAPEAVNLKRIELTNESNCLWYCFNMSANKLISPYFVENEKDKKYRAAVWFDYFSGKALSICVSENKIDALAVNYALKRAIEKNGIPKYITLDTLKYYKPERENDLIFQRMFSNEQMLNNDFLYKLFGIEMIDLPLYIFNKIVKHPQTLIDYISNITLNTNEKDFINLRKVFNKDSSAVRKTIESYIEKFNATPKNHLTSNLSINEYHEKNIKERKTAQYSELNCLTMWQYVRDLNGICSYNFYISQIKEMQVFIKKLKKFYKCAINDRYEEIICQIVLDEPEKIYLYGLDGEYLGEGLLKYEKDLIIYYGTHENPAVSIKDAAMLENETEKNIILKLQQKQIKQIKPRAVSIKSLSKAAQEKFYSSLTQNAININDNTPDYNKAQAIKRFSIIKEWERFCKEISKDGDISKVEMMHKFLRYLFIDNSENKISIQTLYRWLKSYNEKDINGLMTKYGKIKK